MKKFSKILSLIVLFVLVLSVAGCKLKATKEPTKEPQPQVSADLKAARDYVFQLYKDKAENTPADYTVIAAVSQEGVTLTWSVEVTTGAADSVKVVQGDNTITIDVNEMTETEIVYVLKATLTKGDEKVEVSFTHKVPQFKEYSWDEYVKAIEDAKASNKDSAVTVVVKGVVTAMSSKTNGNSTNTVYLQDAEGKGGFYCYGMEADPAAQGIEIGMTVRASGGAYKYSGTYEIAVGCILTILDENKTPVAPKDITADFTAAPSTTDSSITACQGLFVTLKGATILAQDDTVSNGYYKFSLAGKESYVRISSSVCPLSKADQDTFKANHAAKTGYTADVTGIISLYDGAFYITPVTVDAYSNFVAPELTDAEAVAFAKENTAIPASFNKAQDGYQLPVAGPGIASDVAISWAMKAASDFASITENKLTTVVPEADTNVVLVATFTRGDSTDTKEYTVKLEMNPTFITAVAFNALEDGAVAYVQGYVRGYIDQYKSCYLVDGSGEEVYVYGWKDKTNINIKDGDWLQIKGEKATFSGTKELKNGEMYQQFVGYTIPQLLAATEDIADALVTGTVKSIVVPAAGKSDYGNIYIEDEDGNEFYIYGTYNTDGQKYGDWAAEDKLAVGDIVYIHGLKTIFKKEGQPDVHQIKNGVLLLAYTPAAPIVIENDGTAEHPYTIAELLETVKDLAVNAYTDEYYIQGYIISCQQGSYISNMYLADSLDSTQKFLVYSCNFVEGVVDCAYQNDFVVVHGSVKNYSGTLELTNVKVDDETIHGYPTFVSRTAGTSTISLDESSSNNATVTLSATSGTNGSTFTFTVAVDEGFEIDVVTINGTNVTDTDGTYTGTIGGATVVKVTTKEAGSIKSVYTLTVDGLPTAYPKAETENTLDGLAFIQGGQIANFGNGIQIKKDAAAWLKNKAAFELPVLSVVFNFNAKNAQTTVSNQTATKGALYIMFANNADFNNAETVQVTIAEAEKAGAVTVTTTLTDATYIKICSGSCGAVYCDSIVINLNVGE